MQIKRLLDDREVLVGDKVFDAQGRSYVFLEHSGGELVVTPDGGRPVNRTDRGLAKQRLRDYWEIQ